MTNKGKTYLELKEVCDILPPHLKFDPNERIERSVYKTVEGKPLPIINSKLYPEKYYWYSCITKYFKELGCEVICFTAGNYGVFVIPIDVVLHYNRFSGWKGECKKGRQYHVRIKHNSDGIMTFFNFNDPSENIDITQYLIKYENTVI